MASYKKFVVELAKQYNDQDGLQGTNAIFYAAKMTIEEAKKPKINVADTELKEKVGV